MPIHPLTGQPLPYGAPGQQPGGPQSLWTGQGMGPGFPPSIPPGASPMPPPAPPSPGGPAGGGPVLGGPQRPLPGAPPGATPGMPLGLTPEMMKKRVQQAMAEFRPGVDRDLIPKGSGLAGLMPGDY